MNSSALVDVPDGQSPRLIAHRGVHQIATNVERTAQTCRAGQVEPVTHGFIENTLPSMRAAFDAGADVVEIDVHLTRDGVFAVFHDWTLDCQTNGTGITHKQDFASLRDLDLGHGFSSDGQSWPLRGTGVGMMPSLRDVLEAELPGPVLVNFKSDRRSEGKALVRMLEDPDLRAQVMGVYGGTKPTRAAIAGLDGMRGLTRDDLIACLASYVALGWSGYVPPSCRNALIGVPVSHAWMLWGWPHRFAKRMQNAGSDVILWGPYDGSGFSSGIDDAETWARVPEDFPGYVWTNRIRDIGPLARQ